MNVLVLGAGGLLGSCLMQFLAQKKWNLLGAGKSTLDITDYAAVDLALAKSQPDVIINAAAYTAVERAEVDVLAADAVNHLAVQNLAGAAQRIGALLIHFSTDYVFAGEQTRPLVESDISQPLNIYGKTKLAGERAVIAEAAKYFIIRTSWLFGEGENNFFGKMVGLLQSSSELKIVNDQVGGPTYVNDLAAVVATLLDKYSKNEAPSWGVYHYAGYPFISWYEFAAYIQAVLPERHNCCLLPVASSAYPYQAVRPLNSRLDSSQIKEILAISPSDWRVAVNSLVAQRGIQ